MEDTRTEPACPYLLLKDIPAALTTSSSKSHSCRRDFLGFLLGGRRRRSSEDQNLCLTADPRCFDSGASSSQRGRQGRHGCLESRRACRDFAACTRRCSGSRSRSAGSHCGSLASADSAHLRMPSDPEDESRESDRGKPPSTAWMALFLLSVAGAGPHFFRHAFAAAQLLLEQRETLAYSQRLHGTLLGCLDAGSFAAAPLAAALFRAPSTAPSVLCIVAGAAWLSQLSLAAALSQGSLLAAAVATAAAGLGGGVVVILQRAIAAFAFPHWTAAAMAAVVCGATLAKLVGRLMPLAAEGVASYLQAGSSGAGGSGTGDPSPAPLQRDLDAAALKVLLLFSALLSAVPVGAAALFLAPVARRRSSPQRPLPRAAAAELSRRRSAASREVFGNVCPKSEPPPAAAQREEAFSRGATKLSPFKRKIVQDALRNLWASSDVRSSSFGEVADSAQTSLLSDSHRKAFLPAFCPPPPASSAAFPARAAAPPVSSFSASVCLTAEAAEAPGAVWLRSPLPRLPQTSEPRQQMREKSVAAKAAVAGRSSELARQSSLPCCARGVDAIAA
ncbi:hypothetical protein cyc_01086 [Cyclospora cayetanensis]|uniref:Transmembrane protein n=1 Tax=Cyclospora cayetanensis TaxID=88456 RepID=A0A1D3D3A2_9EIME|nr:hypothetical protein cyc_01086 [Cyclospora cayetanensis]